jgi:rhodanese-related sulfurtransferase
MKTIKVDDLKQKGYSMDNIILIDVREPSEYRSGFIDGSLPIPLGEICVEKLPPKKCPVIIYCHSGKRSQEACRKLLAEDSSLDISTLEGGIAAWKQAGLEIKKTGCDILPIDRQAQLAAGSLALFGIIFSILFSPLFYIIPGAISVGLIFAGISGRCGMAKLLAKFPWNK